MFGNRRNLVFRVSIVINIAVLLYAAMQLSSTSGPVEWAPITADGTERGPEIRVINVADVKNETYDFSMRNFEETQSEKSTTLPTVNKTISSTTSITDKLIMETSEIVTTKVTMKDENSLSEETLNKLHQLLNCSDRNFVQTEYQRGPYWVLKNYVRADHGPVKCHESITYTTHAGFEFLDNVLPLVNRWMAPISLSIFSPSDDFVPTVASIRYLRDCTKDNLVKQFVTFHIFFSYNHVPSAIPDANEVLSTPFNCSLPPPYVTDQSKTYKQKNKLLYPVNVARNIAREAALTHYVFASDIELYPSPNLVTKFLNMIARNQKPLQSKHPKIFPISLFEVQSNVKVPLTKTELQKLFPKQLAIPFHKFVCPDCHNIPKAKQWIQAKETNQMDVFHVAKREGMFKHWEPIFIGTHDDPFYDERLSWEGKQDKMPQGYVLCVKNYDFMILNNAFLIHKPGIKRYKYIASRETIARQQSKLIRTVILPELKKLFGVKKGCHL